MLHAAHEDRAMSLRTKQRTGLTSWLIILVILSLVGCGQRISRPDVEYVEGIVRLDGKPLEAATVSLSPVSGGLAAYGRTDSAGIFKLTSSRGGLPGSGAVAGTYKVTILKAQAESSAVASDAVNSEANVKPSIEDYERFMNENKQEVSKTPRITSLVPERYTNPETSGLTATIAQGRNQLEFNLTFK
jgi:hypothetical protein